ncbi:MAG TPA: hypothetical protein VL944_00040 [Candidatus Acidoferrum sp.]|nr:hypothetical protein [Candidatus Acidoferrum sp.]
MPTVPHESSLVETARKQIMGGCEAYCSADYGRAKAMFDSTLQIDPTSIPIRFLSGIFDGGELPMFKPGLERAERFAYTLLNMREIPEASTSKYIGEVFLGFVYRARGDRSKALTQFRKVDQLEKDGAFKLSDGHAEPLHNESGSSTQRIEMLKRHINATCAAYCTGDYENARKEMNGAYTIHPELIASFAVLLDEAKEPEAGKHGLKRARVFAMWEKSIVKTAPNYETRMYISHVLSGCIERQEGHLENSNYNFDMAEKFFATGKFGITIPSPERAREIVEAQQRFLRDQENRRQFHGR